MNLRRKLLAFLQSQKKEAEYTELEYLESTGTQWIDTGIEFQPIKAVINLCFVENNTRDLMGYASYQTTYFGKTTAGLLELGGSYVLQGSNAYKWQEVEFIHNGKISGASCTLTTPDGSITRNGNIIDNLAGKNFCLFNISHTTLDYVSRVKISSAKFYSPDTNKLIADLIPVLDKDFTPCMYDKVSGRFLYNQGDGEFKWKLPNQLEYLESTGTQWIDTGVVPNENQKIEVVGYSPKVNTGVSLVGTRNASDYNNRLQIWSDASGYFSVRINSSTFITTYPSTVKSTIVLDIKNKNFTVNNSEPYALNYTGSLAVNSYGLFLRNNGNGADLNYADPVVIYSCKIWENNKLIQYLIPAFDENLNICMYDLISKTYLYNQGSGTFKGFFEDGSQLVGYLESTGTQYIDTGLIANQLIDKTLYIKMKNTGNSGNYAYNGAYDISGTGLTVQFGLYATSNTQCRTTQNYFDPSYSQTTGLDKSLFHELQMDKTTYWLNGEVVGTHEQTDEEKIKTCVNPFFIFGRSQKNAANSITPMTISRFWIKNADGSYLQNLVPVVKSDNTACMLDLTTKQYSVNKGSGSFTYGIVANLFSPSSPSYVAGYITTVNNGSIASSTLTDTFYIPCKPNTTYLITRSSVKVSGQVWRAATVSQTPYTGMLCPNFAGGLTDDLTLTIRSGANDKYLIFSEGQTMATEDLTKFTVVEISNGNF